MKHVVITIGREYGSGGRLIAKKLSEELGITFYDKELIAAVAKPASRRILYGIRSISALPTASCTTSIPRYRPPQCLIRCLSPRPK